MQRPSGGSPPVAFEFQPTLRGSVVALRPLHQGDYDALYAVASDALIWEQHPDKTRCQPDGFHRFFRQAIESGGALLVTRADSAETIGSSRFHGYNDATREVEIGWTFLARACWGGRFNRDLKRLMVEHAFKWVDRIVFLIAPQNLRSQKAILKIGAIRAGSRLDASGTESNAYVLTPEAWARILHDFPERE
jgi:RimJ/RimL family protein N-acetyltransferase